jgi:hypothetical protein
MSNREKIFFLDPKLKSKLNKIADGIGCKLNWKRKAFDSYQYNKIDIACYNQDASNILHDIAHFAVATKRARAEYDFGLGKGPDSSQCIDAIYSETKVDKIEMNASALGIFWEKQLQLDYNKTIKYHGWSEFLIEEKWKSLSKTIRKFKYLFNIKKVQ